MSLIAPTSSPDPIAAPGFLPLEFDGARIGCVRPTFADELRRWPEWFRVQSDRVVLSGADRAIAARSRAMAACARTLREQGLVRGWRDELYAIRSPRDGKTLFEIERAAVHRFGFASKGVNLNGYVGVGASIRMWVARRSLAKPIDPGMLDTLVGGGVASGFTVWETLLKESGEEAGIPPTLARKARSVGSVHSVHEVDDGLHDEVVYIYDLALPADFVPTARDGEVASFELTAVSDVAMRLAHGEFTVEAALVGSDFLDRHRLGRHPDP